LVPRVVPGKKIEHGTFELDHLLAGNEAGDENPPLEVIDRALIIPDTCSETIV